LCFSEHMAYSLHRATSYDVYKCLQGFMSCGAPNRILFAILLPLPARFEIASWHLIQGVMVYAFYLILWHIGTLYYFNKSSNQHLTTSPHEMSMNLPAGRT
ncbi:MAG: hypothetical protein AAF242_09415, partial [Bacteroidota bacterium]